MKFSRRQFIHTSGTAIAAAGLGAMPHACAAATGDVKGMRVGVIGVRLRGVNHLIGLADHVVAICDADKKILSVRGKESSKRNKRTIEEFSDYRKLLERKDIDAVSIATPNHLHALIAIEACQAGKHVFVEKPVSHNIWEGRQLVEAASKYDKVVQCGMQARSSQSIPEAIKYVQSGAIGEIKYALTTCYKPRKSIGKLKYPLKLPRHVDFDLWCGPADKQQIYRPSLHYDWHWNFNTGNGDLGNQAVHHLDIARWFLGEEKLPPRVISVGGRVGYEDAGETPNTQVVLFDYKKAPLVAEIRGLPKSKEDWDKWEKSMDVFRSVPIGVVIQCEKGYVGISAQYDIAVVLDNKHKEIKRFSEGLDGHYKNWVEACEANDPSTLNAPVADGHQTAALAHAGNISHQLGTRKPASEIVAELKGAKVPFVMTDAVDRMLKHLEKNEIKISKAELTAGAILEVDVENERFKGNDVANLMLTREYREGFAVPEIAGAAAPSA